MSYKQLTLKQRYEIKAYLQAHLLLKRIADLVGVHPSTVGREIERNGGVRSYDPEEAHFRTVATRMSARKYTRSTAPVRKMVESLIRLDLSPEQASEHLLREHCIQLSHQRIYQYVWADKQAGGDLYKHLRTGHKKKRKKYGTKDLRGRIIDRISIDQRPEIVNTKERIGDWEIDTIHGKNHQGALVTAVERKTRFTTIQAVCSRKADEVTKALIQMLMPFKDLVKTITSDNGKEFASHQKIAKALETDFYFAHPYASWERGLNENTNGLIRQYFPKNVTLKNLDPAQVAWVETRLNIRPRKCLDFKSPMEEFLGIKVALGT